MQKKTNPGNSGWNKREIGALWLKQKKIGGEKFLTGNFKLPEGHSPSKPVEVIIFENKDRHKGEGRPTYRVYKSDDLKKGGNQELHSEMWRGC